MKNFDIFGTDLPEDVYGQQEVVSPTVSKADNLQQAKQKKLETLGQKIAPSWVDTSKENYLNPASTDKYGNPNYGQVTEGGYDEWSGNKLWNTLDAGQLQGLVGQAYDEVGLFPVQDNNGNITGFKQRDAQGQLVDYTGPIGANGLPEGYSTLYGFGTKADEDQFKLGTYGDVDPRKRYLGKYEPKVGPEGVDINKEQMALVMPTGVVNSLERLYHGNQRALEGRTLRNEAGPQDDAAYWAAAGNEGTIGTGASEIYKDRAALFGDSRVGQQADKQLLDELYGLSGYRRAEPTQMSAEELNTQAEQLLQSREGFRDATYNDSLGNATAGYGHLLTEAEKKQYPVGTKIPQEQINQWWQEDTAKAKQAASEQLNELNLPDSAYPTLVSMNYQLGTNWDKEHTDTVAAIKEGDYQKAAESIASSKWAKQTPERAQDAINMLLGSQPTATPQAKTYDDYFAEAQQEIAKRMSYTDKVLNGIDAAQATFVKEVGLDFVDWLGELTGFGDVGTEEEKTSMANRFTGYNPYADADKKEKAGKLAEKIYNDISSKDKEVDYSDVYELVKIGITTPDFFGQSLGYIASMFVPFLGWGGKAAKVDKTVRGIEKELAAGTITKEQAKKEIVDARKDVTALNKLAGFAQNNAGIMQMAAGNVNDQIDQYKAEHGEDPSIAKIAQMFTTESVMLGAEKWVDVGILKAGGAIKPIKEAVQDLPISDRAKIAGKVLGVGAGLVGNMGKEAAQEYMQTMGQILNVEWQFDDNGNIIGALDEAGNILTSDDAFIQGIEAAGLGAGAAVQFTAAGTAVPAATAIGKGALYTVDKAVDLVDKIAPTEKTYKEVDSVEQDIITTSTSDAQKAEQVLSNLTAFIPPEAGVRTFKEAAPYIANTILQTVERSDAEDAEALNLQIKDVLTTLRKGGRTREAAELSRDLLAKAPEMVQYYGSDKQALLDFYKDTIVTLTADDEAFLDDMSIIKAFEDTASTSAGISKNELSAIRQDAIEEGKLYRTLISSKAVNEEVTGGGTGYINYYEAAKEAFNSGNDAEFSSNVSKLAALKSHFDNKVETIDREIAKLRQDIAGKADAELLKRGITKNDADYQKEFDKQLMAYKSSVEGRDAKNSKNAVDIIYGVSRKEKGANLGFTVYKGTIAEAMTSKNKGKTPSFGFYSVLNSMHDERNAMKSLYDRLRQSVGTSALPETEITSESVPVKEKTVTEVTKEEPTKTVQEEQPKVEKAPVSEPKKARTEMFRLEDIPTLDEDEFDIGSFVGSEVAPDFIDETDIGSFIETQADDVEVEEQPTKKVKGKSSATFKPIKSISPYLGSVEPILEDGIEQLSETYRQEIDDKTTNVKNLQKEYNTLVDSLNSPAVKTLLKEAYDNQYDDNMTLTWKQQKSYILRRLEDTAQYLDNAVPDAPDFYKKDAEAYRKLAELINEKINCSK